MTGIFTSNRRILYSVFIPQSFRTRNWTVCTSKEPTHVRKFRIRKIFTCEIHNSGLWNPEYSLRIRNPTIDCNPESKFHWQKILEYRPGIRNLWHRIQIPRQHWIPLWSCRFGKLDAHLIVKWLAWENSRHLVTLQLVISRQMMSEKRAQKFHTDDASLPRSK